MATRVTLNKASINELLRGRNGPVVRHVLDITRRVENGAKQRAPVDKGKLRASIGQVLLIEPGKVIGRVGSPLEYAIWQHEGTGIYGPRRRVITPKQAQVLVFKAKQGGPLQLTRGGRVRRRSSTLVFARFVRGTPPNPFLVDALIAESPYPVRTFT